MEYIDTVFVALKDRAPCKVLMSSLQDPDRFILAVKELIDSGYLSNIHWDSSFLIMTVEDKWPLNCDKIILAKTRPNWYDKIEVTDNPLTLISYP